MSQSATVTAETPRSKDPSDPEATGLPPAFSLRFASRGISLALVIVISMQLTFYSTDVLGLDAALVGILFLAARVFDGFTDLVFGFIIDRTKTRWGKARPYELFIVPTWLLVVAVFSTPDMAPAWQAAYIFVTYVLITAVCSTFLNLSEATYLRRSLRGEVRYAKVLARQSVIIMLISAIGSMALPQLIVAWGSQPGGWTMISLVYAVPMVLIGLVRMFTVKELPDLEEEQVVAAPRVGESVRALAKNKYIFIIGALVLLANIIYNMGGTVGTYYFKYILGDIGLLTVVSAVGLVAPLILLLFPMAVRSIGAMNFVKIGLIAAIVGYGLVFALPRVFVAVLVGQLLGSIGVTVITMMVGYFVIECMTYGEWRTGKKVEAVTNSVTSFFSKIGSALAAGGVGLILSAVGYNGLSPTQTPAAESAIISLYSIIPAVLAAAMLVLVFFYRLDKHIGHIHADLAAGIHADRSDLKL